MQLYPVTSSYGGQVYFSLERAAAPYFGIKVRDTFLETLQNGKDLCCDKTSQIFELRLEQMILEWTKNSNLNE